MEPKVQVGRTAFSNALAFALSRTWLSSRERIRRVLRHMLGRFPNWCESLAESLHEQYAGEEYADQIDLRKFLRRSTIVRNVFRKGRALRVRREFLDRSTAFRWDVPKASNEFQLQDMLCLKSPAALDWLVKPHIVLNTEVDHYRRTPIRKGNGETRWIEQPLPLMKRVQRTIAQHVLPAITLHSAAHGFVPGRSIFTAAGYHSGKRLVLCMDLADFFGSIDRSRTSALFRLCGYPAKVAFLLACICTAPSLGESEFVDRAALTTSHLPQGAPTSPGIANAIAFRLDQRLAGLAQSVGADYTRYADDLTFSGDDRFVGAASRVIPLVAAIAMEEGFAVNYRKTRRMYAGHRQSVLGLTVNDSPSASRHEFETLKALLYNCVRLGPASQNLENIPNFPEHLRGRIQFVGTTKPNWKAKLLRLYESIRWPAE